MTAVDSTITHMAKTPQVAFEKAGRKDSCSRKQQQQAEGVKPCV
jgi:hypothetical protein